MCKKTTSRFQKLINRKFKKGNKAIFHNIDNPTLDNLFNKNNNILTHPIDISTKLFIQQSPPSAPTISNYQYLHTHTHTHSTYTCYIRQYSLKDITGFIMEKKGNSHIPISTYFDCNTYDMCLKHLSKIKPLALIKFLIPFSKTYHPALTICYFYFFATTTNKKQYPLLGKLVI